METGRKKLERIEGRMQNIVSVADSISRNWKQLFMHCISSDLFHQCF